MTLTDKLAVSYIEKRGIDIDIALAHRLKVWEFRGKKYIVFFNSNGSTISRLCAVDNTVKEDIEAIKWLNEKGSTGFFNGDILQETENRKEAIFIVESVFNALTVEQLGYCFISPDD